MRSAELLRVFLLGAVPPAQARERVVAMAEQANSEVKRLEALGAAVDWSDDAGAFYGRAALEYGLRLNATQADWANWLVNAIDSRRAK